MSLCAEWWSWEICIFLIGLLGSTPLAANIVYISLVPLVYMVPCGLGLSTATRIGKLLGEKQHLLAKQISQISILIILIFGIVFGIVFYLFRNFIALMFISSTDVAIIELVVKVAPLFCMFLMVDGLQGQFQGVLRGMKLQSKSAVAVLIGSWVITIPLACFLGFYEKLGLKGFWIAQVIGYGVLNILFSGIYLSYDWKEECDEREMKSMMFEKIRNCNCRKNGSKEKLQSLNVSHFSAFVTQYSLLSTK